MLLWCSRRRESNGVGKYLLIHCLWHVHTCAPTRGSCCPVACWCAQLLLGKRTVGSAGTSPSWSHCHPGHQPPLWEGFAVSPCQQETNAGRLDKETHGCLQMPWQILLRNTCLVREAWFIVCKLQIIVLWWGNSAGAQAAASLCYWLLEGEFKY